MFTNTLPEDAKKVLNNLKKCSTIQDFYLSGGTGLALQIGHRESQDLDFFSERNFNAELLQGELVKIGHLESTQLAKGTLNCFIDNVKIQFLHYPYRLLEQKIEWEGIFVSSVLDIACTKLLTISSRGSKKDFIDLYFLLQTYTFTFLFEKLEEKYTNLNYDKLHILKSLIYFEDADNQPLPRMRKEVSWEIVKKEIEKAVKNFKI